MCTWNHYLRCREMLRLHREAIHVSQQDPGRLYQSPFAPMALHNAWTTYHHNVHPVTDTFIFPIGRVSWQLPIGFFSVFWNAKYLHLVRIQGRNGLIPLQAAKCKIISSAFMHGGLASMAAFNHGGGKQGSLQQWVQIACAAAAGTAAACSMEVVSKSMFDKVPRSRGTVAAGWLVATVGAAGAAALATVVGRSHDWCALAGRGVPVKDPANGEVLGNSHEAGWQGCLQTCKTRAVWSSAATLGFGGTLALMYRTLWGAGHLRPSVFSGTFIALGVAWYITAMVCSIAMYEPTMRLPTLQLEQGLQAEIRSASAAAFPRRVVKEVEFYRGL